MPTPHLRALELHLLRCSFPSSPHAPPHPLLSPLLTSLSCGDYAASLASPAAKSLFASLPSFDFADSNDAAQLFYAELVPKCINEFLLGDGDDEDRGYRALVVVAVGVAALLAFAQANVTGPLMKFPAMPLLEVAFGEKDKDLSCNWAEWEGWAQRELMAAGSDLCAKFSHLQYIVFAKILLMSMRDLSTKGDVFPRDELRSISWWLVRLLLIQQREIELLLGF